MATTTPAVPSMTAPLPGATAVGRVRWTILSTYLPPGATTPKVAPAKGTVTFTPKLDVTNLDGAQQASLVFTPKTVTLDDAGHLEVDLVADDGAISPGWEYEVQPLLQVALDAGGYGAASGTIAQKFGVHVTPGAVIDLDDVRPIGKIASSGQLVAQGKPGVGVVGTRQDSATTFVLLYSDGTESAPIQIPVVTSDGTAVQSTPIDTTAPTPIVS